MSTIVDHVFPPTDAHSSPTTALDFSSFTYWREPLPRIADDHLGEKEASENANNAKNESDTSSSSSSQTTVVESTNPLE